MEKLTGIIGTIFGAGAFGYIGYLLYSGNPIESGGRKTRLFLKAQDFLIENLGMTNAGMGLMAVGALILVWGIYAVFFSSDDDEQE